MQFFARYKKRASLDGQSTRQPCSAKRKFWHSWGALALLLPWPHPIHDVSHIDIGVNFEMELKERHHKIKV